VPSSRIVILAVVCVAALGTVVAASWLYLGGRQTGPKELDGPALKMAMTQLSGLLEEDARLLKSPEASTWKSSDTARIERSANAAEEWLKWNRARLASVQAGSDVKLNENTRKELASLQQRLRELITTIKKDLKPGTQAVEAPPQPTTEQSVVEEPKEPILTRWVKKYDRRDNGGKTDIPDHVLKEFVERYTNPEVRLKPYYLEKLKILRAAKSRLPGVYCISFRAEVYHRDNRNRWDKSPVVLNLIAAETPDGVIATYETFAEKHWEFPNDGACVQPVWGVHDYEWREICPFPCMSSYSMMFAK